MIPRQRLRALIFALGTMLAATAATAPAQPAAQERPEPETPKADLVIHNGLVWTGLPDALDAEAIAITGTRIVAVGSDAEIRERIGPKTIVIDAGKRRVIPGITDSHTHILSGGLALSRINLRAANSREEFRDLVSAAVARLSPGTWLLGGRWSTESWPKPQMPNRAWLDDLTLGNPAFLQRMDGHQAVVNSLALKYARIDANGPPDPPGGEIVRDPKTGEPTGILKEAAMDLVAGRIPPPKPKELERALLAAMQHAVQFGITSVHDMSTPDELDVIVRAHKAHVMTLRITTYLSVDDWTANLDKVKAFPVNDDWLRVAGLKGFMDGSLGSRNALMCEPYTDATPETKYPRGMLTQMADPPEAFARHVAAADAAGLQPAVHAIGDEANHILLDIYGSLRTTAGPRDRRPRIEHAQHLLPSDIARFAELGVIASMQPHHKADDGRYAESALGAKRCATSYAFGSLLGAGATVCFGSDWPVVTINPFAGIAAAVGAKTLDGRIWFPEQSISAQQALTAYTVTPAFAAGREKDLGTIAPGKLADIAILSQDILQVGPDQMTHTIATHTFVGGRLVWHTG